MVRGAFTSGHQGYSAQALDKGRPLTVVDGLLAATAIEHNLTLVTRNVKHFADLGVSLFNPWEETTPAG